MQKTLVLWETDRLQVASRKVDCVADEREIDLAVVYRCCHKNPASSCVLFRKPDEKAR